MERAYLEEYRQRESATHKGVLTKRLNEKGEKSLGKTKMKGKKSSAKNREDDTPCNGVQTQVEHLDKEAQERGNIRNHCEGREGRGGRG